MWDVIGNNLCGILCTVDGIHLLPSLGFFLHRHITRGATCLCTVKSSLISALRKRKMSGTCMQGINSMFGSTGKRNAILDYVMRMASNGLCPSIEVRVQVWESVRLSVIQEEPFSLSLFLLLLFLSFSECDMSPNNVSCTPMTSNWTHAPVWCCGFAIGNTPLILPIKRLVLSFEMLFQKEVTILWCCDGAAVKRWGWRRLDLKTEAFMEPPRNGLEIELTLQIKLF